MKLNLTKSIAVAILCTAIALFTLHSALADTIKPAHKDTLRQAAKEVVKDTGVKEQFGQSENGDRLLDQAQRKANQKLNKLADTADSEKELPKSKKLFVDNLNK